MKNKNFLVVFSVTAILTGGLCGCDNQSQSAEPIADTTSAETVNEADNETILDQNAVSNIYQEYLSNEKICKVSRDFKIIEKGNIEESPNGLCGAVQYDFDNDSVNELVTFAFEPNKDDKEDILITLVKINDDKAEIKDSVYLTDILDLEDLGVYSDNDVSIYFNKEISMEIVSAEYNNTLYFGSLLSSEFNYDTTPHIKTFNVFTVENDKITACTIGRYEMSTFDDIDEGTSFAKLLPSSLRYEFPKPEETIVTNIYGEESEFTEKINNIFIEHERYNMYTDIDSEIQGGVYTSVSESFSMLLNEFGLDIEYTGLGDKDSVECSAKFVSKDDSKIKTLINLSMIRGLGSYDFVGCEYKFDSDMEEILDDDELFTEPFENEIEKYEDIFKRPHYYHDIWDSFLQYDYSTEYFVADINQDNEKELILIENYEHRMYLIKIIKSDLTIINAESSGDNLSIYDNGIICISDDYETENNCYIDINSEDVLTGQEALTKISEISATALHPEFNTDYSPYSPENFTELAVIEDIEEIKYTWEKAYIKVLNSDDYSYSQESTRACLIYLDEDDVPELCIYNMNAAGLSLYTYYNGTAVHLDDYGDRGTFDGYIEKGNYFRVGYTYSNGGYTCAYYSFNSIENGKLKEIISFFDSSILDGKLEVNDEVVSRDEYDNKSNEYNAKLTHETDYNSDYYNHDEIIRVLNGETVEKKPETTETSTSANGNTAKVKAEGGLNLHSGAGTTFDKITLIPNGSTVSILETNGEWSKITYQNYTGWVKSSYLIK